MAQKRYAPGTMNHPAAGIRRDDSLRRVRKLTRRVAIAAVAGVGVLGLYVAKALPGHSAAATNQTTATTAPPTTTAPSSGSSSATNSPAVTAPPSPPVTTPRPVHVTTGAS
ncbi:MAG TPA: hypothetical protein VHU17_10445 [Acidimicrobiales bacterium]|nr:hypothetical protein [Acidimicrobiales bacterium]